MNQDQKLLGEPHSDELMEKRLRRQPTKSKILTSVKLEEKPFEVDKREHLPIEWMESECDLIFGVFGYSYEITVPPHIIQGTNAVSCCVKLSVWSEEKKQWVSRPGHGGGVLKKKGMGTGAINSYDIPSTFSAALSLAFKNAARKFGVRLGRSLNRHSENALYFQKDSPLAE